MMNTKEALEKSHIKDTANKNTLKLLVDYANGVTGNSDTNIGDAIKTLADGYGQGGGLTIQQTDLVVETVSGERWATATTTQVNSSYSRTEPIDVSEYDYVAIVNQFNVGSPALRSAHCFLSNSMSSTNIIRGYTDNLNGDISNAYLLINTKDYDWLMLSSVRTTFNVLVYPVFGEIKIV